MGRTQETKEATGKRNREVLTIKGGGNVTVIVGRNDITRSARHQRREYRERKQRISSSNKKRTIASGGRSMSEKTLETATVDVATDLATEETSTTGRGKGPSPLQGDEIETGQHPVLEDEIGTGQHPLLEGGGRDPGHTGGRDQCLLVTGGRDTDNIMLENKL